MARTTSDEELQLKKRARRRLVGAVVLATTVAVVLPMVLDNEPKPVSQNVNIQIPSPDAPAVAPKPAAPGMRDEAGAKAPPSASSAPHIARDLKPEAQTAPVAKAEASAAEKKEPPHPAAQPETPRSAEAAHAAAEPAKAPQQPKAAASEAAKPAAKEAAKAASQDGQKTPAKGGEAVKSTASGKFVVQIAALSDTAKAKQLQQQVSGAGVRAYTEVVKTAKGNVTRVRAGPYDTREAAEKARGRLKSAGLDGKVVPR